MEKRKIPISLPATGEEEWVATRESFISGWLTQGPKVKEFEDKFSKRHSVKHSLATTSCTTGLHLILAAMGIGPGDEVIVPAFTWVATANVVLYCGATPVFADVDTDTNNISPTSLADCITNKTKAVIVVHLFGLCVDMSAIKAVVPDHIKIIEDAACASGASYHGTPAGGLGDAAAFSFHPRKSITTGEGGMVTTNNSALAERMEKLRNHGAEISEEQRHSGAKPYLLPDFNLLGFNYRMTDLQGSVGLVQLAKLDRFLSERQKWAKFYKDELSDIDWLRLPVFPSKGIHAWQAFVVFVEQEVAPIPRNALMEFLQEKGISTRPGTHAVHMLSYYADRYGYEGNDFPNAKVCNDNTMAIPLHNRMSVEDYAYVAHVLRTI